MYSPPYNQVKERREIAEFMRANNFPLLVTASGAAPRASHLPVTIHEEGEQIVIDMHMAKANPQWREFSAAEAMVVFSGPHAYITPRWYEDKERVPTWNYTAVHAYGVPQIVEEIEVKKTSQRNLIEVMDPQWLPQHDALSETYVTMMLRGIVNFRIPVARLETRWKLSQNKGRQEMELIAAALDKSGDPMERALAALTRKHLPEK